MNKKILNYHNRKKHGINPENLKKAIDHDLNLYNNLNNRMMEYIKLVFTIYSLSVPVAYAFYSIYNEQYMVLAGILVMNFIISSILFEIMDLKITINYLVACNIVRIKLLKKDVYSTVYSLLPKESKYMILTLIIISMFLYIMVIILMLTFSVTITEEYMKLSSFALAICSFGLLYHTARKVIKTEMDLKKLEKLDFS